jgi:hypothetical protein
MANGRECWWCNQPLGLKDEPTYVRSTAADGGFLVRVVPIDERVEPDDHLLCPRCVEKLTGERPPDL